VRAIVVIPARYGSTRLAAKALRRDTGHYLVEHVHARARAARRAAGVVIATDDERIHEACASFGAEVAMTSPACASGTDRVAEAARSLDADIIVNLQGDEPEMDPSTIDRVIALCDEGGAAIGTAAARSRDGAAFRDPAVVKAITAADGRALYFTRAAAPYDRESKGGLPPGGFLWHLGIYGFRRAALARVAALAPSPLERTEMLEQLRWLEAGLELRVAEVERASSGIDTEEQYQAFIARWRARAAGQRGA
jgi:3-deoxy-manno-octulosonate cytidylyltransferase (CMP-KDO synthetase)